MSPRSRPVRISRSSPRPTVTHLEGAPGAYRVSLKKGKEKLELDVSAIVVATGIDPYDASQKPEYGYGLYRNVITARDLDEMLAIPGYRLPPLHRATP